MPSAARAGRVASAVKVHCPLIRHCAFIPRTGVATVSSQTRTDQDSSAAELFLEILLTAPDQRPRLVTGLFQLGREQLKTSDYSNSTSIA